MTTNFDAHALRSLTQLLPAAALKRIRDLRSQIAAHNPQFDPAQIDAAVWAAVKSMNGTRTLIREEKLGT